MCNCWRHNPRQRPPFTEIVQSLSTLIKKNASEIDLSVKQLLDNVYEIHMELPGEKC